MGAGKPQFQAEQVADHRLGAGQGIDAGPLAIGRQRLALGIFREARHHRDRRGPGGLELVAGPQQSGGVAQAAPAGAAGALAEAHLQGHICC